MEYSHAPIEYAEYSIEYYQSHITLLSLWLMLCDQIHDINQYWSLIGIQDEGIYVYVSY